ncbi:uncharacterized protein LOC127283632 [Leptopilina boulardi]|uniref:uncharacterized protein LOC127283632 n=1 Tax=Leptopilina boulardi TaxID=63433 RepID=UPI0021F60B6C|nr:uncharacterized protein LOC127283632 [Leptopilina boulardi]
MVILRQGINSEGRIQMDEKKFTTYLENVLFESNIKWPEYVDKQYVLNYLKNIIFTQKGQGTINIYELQKEIINFVSQLTEENKVWQQTTLFPKIQLRKPKMKEYQQWSTDNKINQLETNENILDMFRNGSTGVGQIIPNITSSIRGNFEPKDDKQIISGGGLIEESSSAIPLSSVPQWTEGSRISYGGDTTPSGQMESSSAIPLSLLPQWTEGSRIPYGGDTTPSGQMESSSAIPLSLVPQWTEGSGIPYGGDTIPSGQMESSPAIPLSSVSQWAEGSRISYGVDTTPSGQMESSPAIPLSSVSQWTEGSRIPYGVDTIPSGQMESSPAIPLSSDSQWTVQPNITNDVFNNADDEMMMGDEGYKEESNTNIPNVDTSENFSINDRISGADKKPETIYTETNLNGKEKENLISNTTPSGQMESSPAIPLSSDSQWTVQPNITNDVFNNADDEMMMGDEGYKEESNTNIPNVDTSGNFSINDRISGADKKPETIYTETNLNGKEKENLISRDEISMPSLHPVVEAPVSTIKIKPNVSIQAVSVEKNGIELPLKNMTISLDEILRSELMFTNEKNYSSKVYIIRDKIRNLYPVLKIVFANNVLELIIKDNLRLAFSEGYYTDIKKILNYIINDIKVKYELTSTLQLDGKIASNKYIKPVEEISWIEVQKHLDEKFDSLKQFSNINATMLTQNLVNVTFEYAPTIDSYVSYSAFEIKLLNYLKQKGYKDFSESSVREQIVGYMQGLIKLYSESIKYLVVFNITHYEDMDNAEIIKKEISKEIISAIFSLGPENIKDNNETLREEIVNILDNYEITCTVQIYDSSMTTFSNLICTAESRNSEMMTYIPPPWEIILSFRSSNSWISNKAKADAGLLQKNIYNTVSDFLSRNNFDSNFEPLKKKLLKIISNTGYDFRVIVKDKSTNRKRFVLQFPKISLSSRNYYRKDAEIKINSMASFKFNTTITNIIDKKIFNMEQIQTGIKSILEEYIKNGKHNIELLQKEISAAISTATADIEVNVTLDIKGKLYPFIVKHNGSKLNKI